MGAATVIAKKLPIHREGLTTTICQPPRLNRRGNGQCSNPKPKSQAIGELGTGKA
ncbi:hypothetical protein NI467_01005 [Acinetobacter bohemicus]|uniref:hypothetical protein n=1 Tax=Acinetobacter sp. S4397-1 TaxID=2972915 RepID=UPI00209B82DC|nr:hypothetical protein [Acinetobacter sp. S4397-1]MCO8043959.1 hypothetical protein [Acinetobacter sp. S4397-1]